MIVSYNRQEKLCTKIILELAHLDNSNDVQESEFL